MKTRIVLSLATVAILVAAESRARSQPLQLWEAEHGRGTDRAVRVHFDSDGNPKFLQTSIARFVAAGEEDGLVVDLVAAVHFADQAYYRQLNERFNRYDAVLYELITEDRQQAPDASDDDNAFRIVHRAMQVALGLASQLDQIDYTADNFVHADMTPSEIASTVNARGDTALTVALSVMADVLRQANTQPHGQLGSDSPSKVSTGRSSPSRQTEPGLNLKQELAKQFDRLGESAMPLGPTLNQILVADRNAAAMKVLRHEVAKGRKKIAIFYGAAHMPDFARRLSHDFGLVHQTTTWIDAWDLSKESPVANSLLNVFFKVSSSTNEG